MCVCVFASAIHSEAQSFVLQASRASSHKRAASMLPVCVCSVVSLKQAANHLQLRALPSKWSQSWRSQTTRRLIESAECKAPKVGDLSARSSFSLTFALSLKVGEQNARHPNKHWSAHRAQFYAISDHLSCSSLSFFRSPSFAPLLLLFAHSAGTELQLVYQKQEQSCFCF